MIDSRESSTTGDLGRRAPRDLGRVPAPARSVQVRGILSLSPFKTAPSAADERDMAVAQRRAGLPFVRAAAQLGNVLLFAALPLVLVPLLLHAAGSDYLWDFRKAFLPAGSAILHGDSPYPHSLASCAPTPTPTTSTRRSRPCSWRRSPGCPRWSPSGSSSRSRWRRRRSRCGSCACATGAATGSCTCGRRCSAASRWGRSRRCSRSPWPRPGAGGARRPRSERS